MDGTLLDLNFDNYFWSEIVPEAYAKKNSLDLNSAKNKIAKKIAAKLGSLDWYCIDFWSQSLGLDILSLKIKHQSKVKLRPWVEELLENLQLNDKKLIIVTNAHPDTLEFKMCQVAIGKYFTKKISSHQLGLAKEEPWFWDLLQQVEPFDLNNTLFVDDSIAVLTAAYKYGFRNLLGIDLPDSKGEVISSSDNPWNSVASFEEILIP